MLIKKIENKTQNKIETKSHLSVKAFSCEILTKTEMLKCSNETFNHIRNERI
jgi:hypothetical protein